jgi:hypothetical protein
MKKKEFISIEELLEFLHSKGYNDDKHVIDQMFTTGSFDFKNYHLSVNPFLNDEEEENDESGIAVWLSLGIGIALTLAVIGFAFCKGLELLVKFGIIIP